MLLVAVLAPAAAIAQDLTAEPITEAAPAEIAAPIQGLLSNRAVKVAAPASVALTFWWVKSLPLKEGSGAPMWSQVAEGTIVGAVRIAGPQKDMRGRRVKQPGVYVLRYGIQPQNGDHLGVSPFRDFLLLVPAALDTSAEPVSHDKLVELSPRSISVSEAHPAVLSLDPPMTSEEALKIHTNNAGHKAVVFEVPTSREGQALRFGLILIGEIKP